MLTQFGMCKICSLHCKIQVVVSCVRPLHNLPERCTVPMFRMELKIPDTVIKMDLQYLFQNADFLNMT